MVHSTWFPPLHPCPRLWKLLPVRVAGSSFPFLRTMDPACLSASSTMLLEHHGLTSAKPLLLTALASQFHGQSFQALGKTNLSAAAQLTRCCVPGVKGGEQASLRPRYHRYPPPAQGRRCSSSSHWQHLVLELSTFLTGPSWSGQVSEQMLAPRHATHTCQPVEQPWKVPGPFPIPGPLSEGGIQVEQEGQTGVVSEAVSRFPPGKWKGKADSCQDRSIFQFSFSQSPFDCSIGGKQVEWKPSYDGGKGSEVGPGLPLICHMTTDYLPGPQPPVTEEERQPVPLFSPLCFLGVCLLDHQKQPEEW